MAKKVIAVADSHPELQANGYDAVGNAYLDLGIVQADSSLSDSLTEEAMTAFKTGLRRRNGQDEVTANDWITNYNNIAELFLFRGEMDSARIYAERAEKHLVGEATANDRAIVDYLFGEVELAEKNVDAALLRYQNALTEWQKISNALDADLASAHLGQARCYEALGENTPAIRQAHLAICALVPGFDEQENFRLNPDPSQLRGRKALLDPLLLKARQLAELPDHDSVAVATYELVFALHELHLLQAESDEAKLFMGQNQDLLAAFDQAQALAIRRYQSTGRRYWMAKAFELSEKKRARVLLENYRHQKVVGQIKYRIWLEHGERARQDEATYHRLYREWQGRENAYRDPQAGANRTALARLANAAWNRYQDSLAVYRKRYPRFFQRFVDLRPIGLDEVQQNLLPDSTALLEYSLEAHRLQILQVQRGLAQVLVRDLDSTFFQDLELVIADQRVRTSPPEQVREVEAASHRLYQALLGAPLDLGPDIRRLIIVPDRRLAYLAFGALLMRPSGLESWNAVDPAAFLISRYIVNYDYSATMLAERAQHHRILPDNKLIGVGAAEFAPGGNLKYLFAAVDTVCDRWGGRLHRGAKATPETFLSEMRQADVGLACVHGISNDRNPLDSHLLFRDGDKGTKPLYLYELFQRNLPLNLLFLASCETAVGQEAGAEGIMSIGRSFAAAGCASIVVSLWNVSDNPTSSGFILQRYFLHLGAGMEKDAALRQAKLDFLNSISPTKDPHMFKPYWWAVWVPTGAWAPTPMQEVAGRFPIWWTVLGVVAVMFLLWRWQKRRRARTLAGTPFD
ncbi:MAG: CHAT domain-containing tetratricopeptide repeat protein [Bacteroidota bacterium]